MATDENDLVGRLANLETVVLRHEKLISVILGAITDHACLVEHGLMRCDQESCSDPATVHYSNSIFLCDYHCAMIVVTQNDAENQWVDLPDAVRIRRIRDYVDLVKRYDEPEAPAVERLH